MYEVNDIEHFAWLKKPAKISYIFTTMVPFSHVADKVCLFM